MRMEFNEDTTYSKNQPTISKPSGMIGFLIKTGIVKDKQQANYILFGIIGVLVIIFFISSSSMKDSTSTKYDPSVDDPVLDI